MNRSLLTACLLLSTSFALAGCKVQLEGEGEVETPVLYRGDPESASTPYISGLPVRIISANGGVNVVPGGSDQIQVTFSPSVMGTEGAEDSAQRQMNELLSYSLGGNGEIVIQVIKDPSGAISLAADIDVVLPAAFNGELSVLQDNGGVDLDLSGTGALSTVVDSDNGSVNVVGARGRLDVVTDNGSVDVDVDAWSNADGQVRSGNGSITVALPADANGSMTVATTGQIIEQGLPASWTSAENTAGKSYTMGTGVGGQVDISNAEGLGDVTLIAR